MSKSEGNCTRLGGRRRGIEVGSLPGSQAAGVGSLPGSQGDGLGAWPGTQADGEGVGRRTLRFGGFKIDCIVADWVTGSRDGAKLVAGVGVKVVSELGCIGADCLTGSRAGAV